MKKIFVILFFVSFSFSFQIIFAQSSWEAAEKEKKLEEKKRRKNNKKKSKEDIKKEEKEVHRKSQKWDDRYDKKIGRRTRGNQVPQSSASLSNENRRSTSNKNKNRNKAKSGVPKAAKKNQKK